MRNRDRLTEVVLSTYRQLSFRVVEQEPLAANFPIVSYLIEVFILLGKELERRLTARSKKN